jgi:hypothetical protein
MYPIGTLAGMKTVWRPLAEVREQPPKVTGEPDARPHRLVAWLDVLTFVQTALAFALYTTLIAFLTGFLNRNRRR